MTDTDYDEWVAGLITDEQRAQAAAAVARLTPEEQTRVLVEVYATATAHGGDTSRMIQLGRDVVATVRLRGLPGYREMLTA
ncbi:hypothetical protein ABT061_15895 [Streptosporangium sp. NPDC002544]|uniref:hypothetical protein n=1 Tax=Streptosporangium sp. NPDC002544 TaxID=3154538 RepID=UPI00332DB99A